MKKGFAIFLFSIVLLNLVLISAQDIPGIPSELEKVRSIGENLSAGQITADYLQKEWMKILEKNPFTGAIIAGYRTIAPYVDPIFMFFFGMTPTLGWLFPLTIVIWLFFIIYIYRIFDMMPISRTTILISYIGSVIVISITHVFKLIAGWIIKSVYAITEIWWLRLIVVTILIAILIILAILSKQFEQSLKELRKKQEEDLNREKLKKETELLSSMTHEITKG